MAPLPAGFLDAVVCPGCARTGKPEDFIGAHNEAVCLTKGCGYEWPDDERAPTLREVLTRDDGGRWNDVDMRPFLEALLGLLGYAGPAAWEVS